MEDISEVVGRGFSVWKSNLHLALPFVLRAASQLAFFLAIAAAVALVIGFDTLREIFSRYFELAGGDAEAALRNLAGLAGLVRPYLPVFILASALAVLGGLLIQVFFDAGAVGMARRVLEEGRGSLEDVLETGKRRFLDLLLANILLVIGVGVLTFLLGLLWLLVIFILKSISGGLMAVFMIMGVVFLIVYFVLVSLAVIPVKFAVVIDDLGPFEGVMSGLRFFWAHKLDVFLIWLLVFLVGVAFSIFTFIFELLGVELAGMVIGVLVSILVIEPLSVVWWTRLYLTRTGRSY